MPAGSEKVDQLDRRLACFLICALECRPKDLFQTLAPHEHFPRFPRPFHHVSKALHDLRRSPRNKVLTPFKHEEAGQIASTALVLFGGLGSALSPQSALAAVMEQ
jgi:hypothetical protein